MVRPRLPRFGYRSVDLATRLDTFLVCAICAVLGNRAFLIATGYPQVGNSALHISHAIWGAVMMGVAIVAAISFLGPFTRSFVAFLGGAGFGWFIDEIGKFISRDTSYFFQPAVAVIYLTFVATYLAFRVIKRRRLGPDEAMLNALESLKAAVLGQLDEPRRLGSLQLLHDTRATGPLVDEVIGMLSRVDALPAVQPRIWARVAARVRATYRRQAATRGFPVVVGAAFVGLAIVKLSAVVTYAWDHGSINRFPERVSTLSSLLSTLLVVVGAVLLPRHRRRAYQWFEAALLVEIFVTQVFVFAQRQLAGLSVLALNVVLLIMVHTAMHEEPDDPSESGDPEMTSQFLHRL